MFAMQLKDKISRLELREALKIGYQTLLDYETYGWIPKAKKLKGIKEVFYTKKDVQNLVNLLKQLKKLKITADKNFLDSLFAE